MRFSLIGVLLVVFAAGGQAPPLHVAVGDSLAAGMGADPAGDGGFVSLLTDQNPTCDASPCSRLELVNLASPGATSDVVVATQLDRAVELISAHHREGGEVALLTVTVGGNDLFGSVFASCRRGPTEPCRQAAAVAFTSYLENLHRILGELRSAAGPETPIVTMTLYTPFRACLLADLAPAADTVLEGGMSPVSGFNDLIRIVAGSHGATVVETGRLLDTSDFVGGLDCIHPNAAGHEKLASAFAAALDG